ncbi:MAG: hypothetical protein U0031_23890 [Thermomicrobiales bacterium]
MTEGARVLDRRLAAVALADLANDIQPSTGSASALPAQRALLSMGRR